jgi:hypothetical protein
MSFKWRDFTDNRTRPDAYVPRVTVQSKGNVGLNAAAFKALGEPEAVVFRYDEEGRAFALRPARPDEKGAVKVRKQNAANSYVIGAKSFSNFMRFPDVLQSFTPSVVDGMLVVELAGGASNGNAPA